MPPEVQRQSMKYGPSLDVFSFGHLSLFTVTQKQVQPLPPTYTDSEGIVQGMSELKRRGQSVEAAEQLLPENHSLLAVMKLCLQNLPGRRPSSAELVTRLSEMVTPGATASPRANLQLTSRTPGDAGTIIPEAVIIAHPHSTIHIATDLEYSQEHEEEILLDTKPITPTETRTLTSDKDAAARARAALRGADYAANLLETVLTTDDLINVKSALVGVTARWKHIGLALGLRPDQLDVIEAENRKFEDCLTEALKLWLKKAYNTERFGEPSWELLARAVANQVGGNNPALAQEITKKYGGYVAFALWQAIISYHAQELIMQSLRIILLQLWLHHNPPHPLEH
jgi:hypothetical protein